MPRSVEHPLTTLILKYLEAEHLLSAMELQDKLDLAGYRFNKTSVYRALSALLEKKLICQHQFDLKEAKFELRAHHHDHLLCEQCGELYSIGCISDVPAEVAGHLVTHHHLTLVGVCKDCREKAAV